MDKILSNAMEEKKKIISEMDSIILSTVDLDGNPNSSYAPTAIDKDGNFYIYISKLSKHTQNLLDNDKVSFMIIEDECKAENLFARRRLTINSKSEEIIRDTLDWNQKIDLLENRFTEQISYLKNMMDFHLFKLTPINGLLVHGFGRAFNFTGKNLQEVIYLNEKGHTEKK